MTNRIQPRLTISSVKCMTKHYDIDYKREGSTLLHIACHEGDSNVVIFILRKGARTDITDRYGDTPLIIACRMGHYYVVRTLVNFGADTNSPNYKIFPEAYPLFVAIQGGHIQIIIELLEHKASPNKDVGGISPLTLACICDNPHILEVLLDRGGDPNVIRNGLTVLDIAKEQDLSLCVEVISKSGKVESVISRLFRRFKIWIYPILFRGDFLQVEDIP